VKQTFPIFLFLTLGFGILYWLLKPPTIEFSTMDSDYDGVIDAKDKDINTTWLTDTSNYKLKDYVDSDGLIDRSKTKNLCNCWDFPNISDRETLKCKDNLNWFVYENTLIEYRMEGSENGRFYSAYSSIIATQKDNNIEKKHESLFPEHYEKTEVVTINEPPLDDRNKLVVISYKGTKYQLKKGFITDKGMDYNTAKFRFKNNKWEIQTNPPNGVWTNSEAKDIHFLLTKVATEIKSIENHTIKIDGGKKDGSNNGNNEVNTNADDYWIKLNKEDDYSLNSKKSEIIISFQTKKPSSKAGKEAEKSVKNRILNF
jgi:hypothetical protein